jgi:hypothetical protein
MSDTVPYTKWVHSYIKEYGTFLSFYFLDEEEEEDCSLVLNPAGSTAHTAGIIWLSI